jgi:hypothetical protein
MVEAVAGSAQTLSPQSVEMVEEVAAPRIWRWIPTSSLRLGAAAGAAAVATPLASEVSVAEMELMAASVATG